MWSWGNKTHWTVGILLSQIWIHSNTRLAVELQTGRGKKKTHENCSLKPQKFCIALGKKQPLTQCCSICFYPETNLGTSTDLIKTQIQGILKWVKYIQNTSTRKSFSYAFNFAWGEILPAYEAPKCFEVKRCHIPDPGQKQGGDLCFKALLLFLTGWVISLLLFIAF